VDELTTLKSLKEKAREFRDNRDWLRFHNPKDLAISASIEVAELLELFQWESKSIGGVKQDENLLKKIKEEVADVMIYLLHLCNALDIDLSKAVMEKFQKNEEKYPAEKYKGKYK
jgi:NTP pyrophosphatase (non-canonical NTP hydrolase)